jgi:hypothetical protein
VDTRWWPVLEHDTHQRGFPAVCQGVSTTRKVSFPPCATPTTSSGLGDASAWAQAV